MSFLRWDFIKLKKNKVKKNFLWKESLDVFYYMVSVIINIGVYSGILI